MTRASSGRIASWSIIVSPPNYLFRGHQAEADPVKQGWGPLCEFLGVRKAPKEDLPRINDTKTFLQNMEWLFAMKRRAALMRLAKGFGVVGAAAAAVPLAAKPQLLGLYFR